jgi:hypothetical protein
VSDQKKDKRKCKLKDLTKYSKAQNLPIFLLNNQQSSSWVQKAMGRLSFCVQPGKCRIG